MVRVTSPFLRRNLVGDEGCLHAIDIHPIAIETVSKRIKEVNLKNVILSKTDALETGLPCKSYDLILLFGVIPAPVLPLKRLLPEMHRLLKPGGTMAVWTALPLWSPKSITEHGLFIYVGEKDGVHIYNREGCEREFEAIARLDRSSTTSLVRPIVG